MMSDTTNAARQARHKARLRRAGMVQCTVMIPRSASDALLDMAQYLRGHPRLPATEFVVYWRDERGRLHPLRDYD